LLVVLLVIDRYGIEVDFHVFADDLKDFLLQLGQVGRAVAKRPVVRHQNLQPFFGDGR